MSELEKTQPLPTSARISLGQTGPSIPMREQLRFQLDHALARDAVHAQLDVTAILRGLQQRGLNALSLHSAAGDRRTYLRRPDLGRKLNHDSIEALKLGAPRLESETWVTTTAQPPDIAFILADGLSALALERHALPLLDATLPLLIPNPVGVPTDRSSSVGWCSLTPVVIVSQARVAIGDEIGHLLGAKLVVLFIGERPGLSSPDSLGVYLTWNPRPGRTDAERNCISNIRAEGLSYADAAARIAYYIHEAQRLQTTGITLKDPALPLLPPGQ